MRGTWERGGLGRIACRLGWQRATGSLSLCEATGAEHAIYLRHGDVVSIELDGHELDSPLPLARGVGGEAKIETRLGRLAERGPGSFWFDAGAAAPSARMRFAPTSLLLWARQRLRAELDVEGFAARIGERKVSVGEARPADPAMLLPVERRMLRALAQPRTLAELGRIGSRGEALYLVWLLENAGELRFGEPTGSAEAARTLGVAPDAPPRAIKSAFRRLVRELHPDRHRDAPAGAARAMGQRLMQVTDAYRELTASRSAS
jgi:DnaJ-like protein